MENESTGTPSKMFRDFFTRSVEALSQRPLKHGECQTPAGQKCNLCAARRIEYEDEYRIKDAALQEYWKSQKFAVPLRPLIPSPLGRNYRVVTKRKAFSLNGKLQLGLIGIDEETSAMTPMSIVQCMIEPADHAEVYRCVEEYLNRREWREDAEGMNYVIVKGNYTESTVIFNLASFSSTTRQFINRLSKHLTHTVPSVVAVFVFIDEKRSQYYLPQRQKNRKLQFQKIFGKPALAHTLADKRFVFSPLSFSQTNLSILEQFTATAKEMLALGRNDTLFDLYCGYGLFSISMASAVKKTVGIELSWDSIHDAVSNARRMKISNCTYIESDINEESLERILSPDKKITKVILDPPRNGTKPGVIEIIAATEAERVIHIFCDIDLMPAELQRWNNTGYTVADAIPFDMFPGTGEVEMMVALERI